jgi:S1-C subfamily serine protease
MLRKIAGQISFTLLAAWASSVTATEYCSVPANETLGAVVRVGAMDSEGSGVIIGNNLIATAAHVIEDATELTVNVNGIRRRADVISLFPDRDLALLLADTGSQRPIPMRYSLLQPKDSVWAIGYPLGGNQIASHGRYQGMVDGEIRTTASVNLGQSGGGLISCENGEHVLAGIITAFGAIDMGDHYIRLDDYSISVPIDYVLSLMYAEVDISN